MKNALLSIVVALCAAQSFAVNQSYGATVQFAEPQPGDPADLKLKARTDKDNPIGYVEGEDIRFDFFLDGVEALPEGLSPAYVVWERTGDDGLKAKGTNAISLAEGFSITTSLATNGIVRIEAYLAGPDKKKYSYVGSDGKTANITFSGGAGVATEKMKLSTVEPADFDQFWATAKERLASVPVRADLVDVTPSNLTNNYYVYAASVDCYGPRPVTGWLTKPRKAKERSLPAIVYFEGYGVRTTAPTPPTSGSGQRIRFNVNAHGYDLVGHDDQYYVDFTNAINPSGRKTYALEPSDYDTPDDTYLYYMALRAVRAFDYLKSLPEWNGTVLIAAGGSQGGLQTMWSASLVEGLTEAQPYVTWGCDIGDPLPSPGPLLTRNWGIPSVPGAYYFDAALHAKRIPVTCPVTISRIGMGDYTCPPRGVLLSYYNMRCPVTATLVQGSTHTYVPPATNQTFTISKEANANPDPDPEDPPVVSGGFAKSFGVTFSGYSGGEALTDFPVLVRLSPAIQGFSYSDFKKTGGGDLRFYDAAGNMLAHEIDTWNTSGESTVWVKVPSLSATTAITAKYGCAAPPEAADPKSVWSNGYVGVWHLGGSGLSHADSTANGKSVSGNSSYAAYMASGAAGAVGSGVALATSPDADGKYRGGLQVSDPDSLYTGANALTVEAWGFQREFVNDKYLFLERKTNAHVPYSARLSYSNDRAQLNYSILLTNTVEGTGKSYGSVKYVQAESELNVWNHHALVIDNETSHTGKAYLNGLQKATQALTEGQSLFPDGGTLAFGNTGATGERAFPGVLDELRVSRVARSAAWVKATYDTVMKSDFATCSSVSSAASSGYAAWIAGKGISGANAAADNVTNGIANAVRYAFDIDPATSDVGTPIIQVVRDASGNPCVEARELAEGRSDVTFGILATEDLTDWSSAVLIPMKKFSSDSLWKPTASESSSYVYPAQMFFTYRVDIQQ